MTKLAIITTHPIQYNAPLFREMCCCSEIAIKVFYTWSQAQDKVPDRQFKQEIKWDIPLLDGYDYTFVENRAKNPGMRFNGIKNPTLNSEIEKWGADAVMIYGWSLSSHLKAIRYFSGRLPVYFRGDSTLFSTPPNQPVWRRLLRRYILRWIYSYIDIAFYVGTSNKKYFEYHNLQPSQLVYVPHAIDNNRFSDSADRNFEADAALWRKELGFSQDDIVILYAGKFQKEKKKTLWLVQQFIAWQQQQADSKLKLLMVGQGEVETEMKQASAGRSDIVFLPFQNQTKMPLIYRLGDVLILPSTHDSWGLCINEAMACGRAVIATNKTGCAADLIVNGKTGWSFDIDSDTDIARIFNGLDKSELVSIGKHNSEFIRAWSYSTIIKTVVETVKQ